MEKLAVQQRLVQVLLVVLRASGISNIHAEPFALEASSEVPIYFSFTTGEHASYGIPYPDDGTNRMMLWLQFEVFCRIDLAACTFVDIGRNNDCSKVLEAPNLPPIKSCIQAPGGIFVLKLRGTLQKNTQYDLVILSTLPPAAESIQWINVKTLAPDIFIDISKQVYYEQKRQSISPNYVTQTAPQKQVSAFELVTPLIAKQGVTLQQYTFKVTGSSTPFASGDKLRIFSSPFLFPDEGLSFGGACDGFDVSAFANPLRDVTCQVEALPAMDARVGNNVVALTFGSLSNLADVPQYFRISLNTPKHMGTFGLWFIASKDTSAAGSNPAFDNVIPAIGSFFVSPVIRLVPSTPAGAISIGGASQRMYLSIEPGVNIYGNTVNPPRITVNSPTFHEITTCSLNENAPEAAVAGIGSDAYCVLLFRDNMNLYVYQSVNVSIGVKNPTFAIAAESWRVTVQSSDGTMSASNTFMGWPVYTTLPDCYIVPLTMEFGQYNELEVYFRPSATSPTEARLLVTAPPGFLFEQPCAFDIINGFPHQGVQCSNPLSGTGRNLYSIRLPLTTAFEKDRFYAITIYPIRNPYPGSYTHGQLDASAWRVDILTTDGSTVLETNQNVPLGPYLRGFTIYPGALLQPTVIATVRSPSSENQVTIRMRTTVAINIHGQRILITAPYGYRWKIHASVSVFSGSTPMMIANLAYDSSYPPVLAPHNQIELTLIDPKVPMGGDLSVQGTVTNAAIDASLHSTVQSANVWVLEIYEPSAGWLQFDYRQQAAVFEGFLLQAITGGSVVAWLPLSAHTQKPIMISFRLGTALIGQTNVAPALEFHAPRTFTFPLNCAAGRISPVHLAVDGYTFLPAGSIASCVGRVDAAGNHYAQVTLTTATKVEQRVLYVLLLEAFIPSSLPANNTWIIKSFLGTTLIENQTHVAGFRLATPFLSAVYHPGTSATGEDLRVGASDNRVLFSIQPSSGVQIGGTVKITAPYRFAFARDCKLTVYTAQHLLNALQSTTSSTVDAYHDLPPVATCRGVWNTATLSFTRSLDVAIRYAFRISISNPVLPHPTGWPLAQDIWRIESFDAIGAPLNAAEIAAFFLWAFAHASIVPMAWGASEQTLITVEVQPSLTIPPEGFVLVAAPLGFVIPVPCQNLQLDTYGNSSGFDPLPPATSCERGPGGSQVVKLKIDKYSYVSAGLKFRFRIGIQNPSAATADREVGERWSISSAELTPLGEAFLERNPVVTGYPIHDLLKSFTVHPQLRLAGRNTQVTFEMSVPAQIGTFEVVTTTATSYLIVDMPTGFSTPLLNTSIGQPNANGVMLYQCLEFVPVYPQPPLFPVNAGECRAPANQPTFRLKLTKNLLVGPDYRFTVKVTNPTLNSTSQAQLVLANIWQVRLVRVQSGVDVTYASRSVAGYRVLPFLTSIQIQPAIARMSVQTQTFVSVSFKIITKLSAVAQDAFRITPPPSIINLAGRSNGTALCQLWVARTLIAATAFECTALNHDLMVNLRSSTAILEQQEVQVDFALNAGNASLTLNSPQNTWSVMSVGFNSTIWDQSLNFSGFRVYSTLANTAVKPSDISAMSFNNYAMFEFKPTEGIPAGSSFMVFAPAGFTLYPMTFQAGTIPGGGSPVVADRPSATQGSTVSTVVILLKLELRRDQAYFFQLTIGNPAVSPPQNEWIFDIRSASGDTLNIDSRVPGFVVQSQFNTSLIEGQLDEPLSENFVHVIVAVRQRLAADSILTRSSCSPTVNDPVCPSRQGISTLIVVTAPTGFVFQPTCGYWVLSRVGSRHHGLPPGSLCTVDPSATNVARVQVGLSLEPLRLYEFTLQIRNAISVPLANFWQIHAVQDGVTREYNAQVPGFALRQLRTVRITPTTSLAGVVDNTVTVQMRSERPITRGSFIIIVAPVGFVFDPSQVTSSFTRQLTTEAPAPSMIPSSIRLQLDQQDFMAPNTYFFVSVRVQNPSSTPVPNYWFFYLQTIFLEHIDLRRYFDGFVIAHSMLYCQAYPNTLPWNVGTPNDISMFFVTTSPIFTSTAAPPRLVSNNLGWQLSLVAPSGFEFPRESQYSDLCLGFRRWGGKATYDQLPELGSNTLICVVKTTRSVLITVPPVLVNATRYSFRLNVTTAPSRNDIALQDPWRLTVLESGQILHLGESPSPLLGAYYNAQWYYAQSGVQAPANTR